MRLGKLITLLEAMPQDAHVRFARIAPPEPDAVEWSVPDGAAPREFMSYRGYYERLGLDWTPGQYTPERQDKTVAELLAQARECVGKTFRGYKGGDYTMHVDTLVHVAEHGSSGDDVPVGVELRNGVATILIAAVESW